MITTCLTHFSDVYQQVTKSSGLVGVVQIVVVLALAFPILAAPFARAAYHRRVTRFDELSSGTSSAGRVVGASRTAWCAFSACSERRLDGDP